MPEIRPVVNTSSRYFHVLFYDIKHISNTSLVPYSGFFKKLIRVLKKAVANKWLDGTMEAVGDIKRQHAEQEFSPTSRALANKT